MSLPATARTESSSGFTWGNSSNLRRRTKEDWSGVTIGNAFKNHLAYFIRLSAQTLFYDLVFRVQRAAARLAGQEGGKEFEPKVQAQLSPCFTNYPPPLAAISAIGYTGILEFKTRTAQGGLTTRLSTYISRSLLQEFPRLEPETLKRMAQIVADIVEVRLLLEDIQRYPDLSSVENYRLFAASENTLHFPTVPSILYYVILFGDVLPDWRNRDLHPQTQAILTVVEKASDPYFFGLKSAKASELRRLGEKWVKAVIEALSVYLPEKSEAATPRQVPGSGTSDAGGRYSDETGDSDRVAPPGGKHPPALFDSRPSLSDQLNPGRKSPPPGSPSELVERWLKDRRMRRGAKREDPSGTKDSTLAAILTTFQQAMDHAGGQDRSWEDTRSDIVEQFARNSPFAPGPVTGQATEGHEVSIPYAGEHYKGQLFDRPIETQKAGANGPGLLAECEPIYRRLKKLTFPSPEPSSVRERFLVSGGFDPARLPVAEFSDAVFRRHRQRQISNRQGRPVILIVNDGSGSVGQHQMKLMKVLSMAWFKTSQKNGLRLLAGMYHTAMAQQGMSGPVVEWLYHPEKTVARSTQDALRSIAALPDKGSGGQADALSLQYMLNEAVRVARGRSVYLVLLADCKWCVSFPNARSTNRRDPKGAEGEVRMFFENARRAMKDRLHATLVGLAATNPESYGDVVDKVIAVTESELTNYAAVADKVGSYVATCMRERNKIERR